MAQRSKKNSLLVSLSSLPTDNASAEAAWRQALLLRELSRDDRVTARKRRAEDELEAQRLLTEAARMRVRSSKFETDSFDDFKQQAA
jgi:hypothetical protein